MTRILVTGGSGFIGRHLCRKLSLTHDVICLDEPRDVVDPISEEVDEIYNLACPASPVHYQSDPVRTVKTNVLGAISVLDLARKCGAKVLQASTSEIYGDPTEHPQTESYWGHVNPIGPRACYDEGKRCAETLFADYHRQYGTDIRIARIFNTYGPGMKENDGRVISNFIRQGLHGESLTVYGDGTQRRSFCYIDDMVEGLIRLMASSYPWPVNLGNPEENVSIAGLAEIVIALTGNKSNIEMRELPTDDPVRRCPDITLAKTILGWQPIITLSDGLHRMIDNYSLVA